jgi:hypothetical protein
MTRDAVVSGSAARAAPSPGAFVPVGGEILADLTIDGATRHPIALFDLRA